MLWGQCGVAELMTRGLSDDMAFEIKYKGKKKDCTERGKEKEVGPFSTTKALMTQEMLASVYKGFSLCFHVYVCNVRTSVCVGQNCQISFSVTLYIIFWDSVSQ